ncbi:DHA2 family efflux MFS transporter permease subunit [Parapusillimonas sp. SGNA-6]|nr:DHA2 family efflux MFS transporter permease subunit [Parapusillimonas sp. SGNA-6]
MPPETPAQTAAPPLRTPSAAESRSIRMIPFIVGCALFMQMLDATVVATALPVMAVSLDASVVRMNIAITSYLLAVAVFVPISGWAADRYGSRKVFISAIVLFMLSSLGCAASANIGQLVASRVAQGMAGAMMVPVGRIILLRTVPKTELLKAMSFLSLPALLGPVIGPPLGGFLVTYASWHWIFLINIPVGILGLLLILRYIPADLPVAPRRLDWIGFFLSGLSLATLVSGFEALGHRAMPMAQLLALIVTGLVSGILYVVHARRTPQPILDLSLLRTPTFAIATLGGNLCRFAIGASPFLLAILLQVGFGLSPFAAGMITFTSAVGAMIMKLVATPIIQRFGFKRVLVANAVLAGAFVALCGLFRADTPIWVMAVVLVAGGFFRSLQFTAVNTLTYADLGSEAMSRASSFAATAQQLGITLGVATAAVTLNLSMAWRGGAELAVVDVVWGFIVVGLITAGSLLSFLRLPANAGDHLHQNKPVRKRRKRA